MPKLVDHAERRQRIIQAAWRLIAERGIDAATMREIAREAGYANGALSHYFPDKEALLRAAFEHVYSATNERIAAVVAGRSGVAALRAFCCEVLPLDDLKIAEARMMLSVWSRVIVDEALEAVHTQSMVDWRTLVLGWLAEGRQLGQVRTGSPDDVLTDQLMSQLMGAQIMVAAGGTAGPEVQEAALEEWITRLGRP